MVCVTLLRAGMDSVWEQEKLKATLREMPENAADRASERQASIAQNKRAGACHPQRQAHALLGAKHSVVISFLHSTSKLHQKKKLYR